MGAAKKRGTFEQRQQAAYDRIDSATAELREHVEKLERLDLEAEARMQTMAAQFITHHWQYSGIERRMLRRAATVAIDPAILAVSNGTAG